MDSEGALSLESRSGLDPWKEADLPEPPVSKGFGWLGVVGPSHRAWRSDRPGCTMRLCRLLPVELRPRAWLGGKLGARDA